MKNIDYWKAPKDAKIPDFIICGAMKCGTVHNILDSHPKISIPDREINFFDIDDHFEHSDFSFYSDGQWIFPDITIDHAVYWNWYSNFFSNAPYNHLIGEDSTFRISLQEKQIKTIVCLRNPTIRAYSQYWHMLRTGRAIFDFEGTIRFTPHYVLNRSMYFQQIQNFLKYIPKDRVFFFILEEYLSDKETVAQRLLEYLDFSFKDLPDTALYMHSNKGRIPKYPKLQIVKNRLLRNFGHNHYVSRLPYSTSKPKGNSRLMKTLNIIHSIMNPMVDREIPKMNPQTKRFLDQYFRKEMWGIDELIGLNVTDLWFNNE